MSVIGKTNVYIVPQGSVKCLSFDGVDDYVDVLNSPSISLPNDFTVMAWVMLKGWATAYNDFVDKRSNYVLDVCQTNFRGQVWSGSNNPKIVWFTSVSLNRWYHVAFVRDTSAGLLRLYVDGIQRVTGDDTTVGLNITNSGNLWLGGVVGGVAGYWHNGLIGEVRVYNRALSSTEITTLYNGGDVWDGLVLYLPGYGILEDQNKWWDFSGNGNHGTIYGAKVVWDRIR